MPSSARGDYQPTEDYRPLQKRHPVSFARRLQATVKTRLAHHPGCKLSARGQVLTQSRQTRQSGAKWVAAWGEAGAWLESTWVTGSASRSLFRGLRGLVTVTQGVTCSIPTLWEKGSVQVHAPASPGALGSVSGSNSNAATVASCITGTQMLPLFPKALPNILKTLKNR